MDICPIMGGAPLLTSCELLSQTAICREQNLAIARDAATVAPRASATCRSRALACRPTIHIPVHNICGKGRLPFPEYSSPIQVYIRRHTCQSGSAAEAAACGLNSATSMSSACRRALASSTTPGACSYVKVIAGSASPGSEPGARASPPRRRNPPSLRCAAVEPPHPPPRVVLRLPTPR